MKQKTVRESDLKNIIDHRENTAGDMVKAYTLAQVSMIDNIDKNTVVKSGRYVPVRVDSSTSRKTTRRWYSVRYVMLSELEKIISKRSKRDIKFMF